MFGGVAWVAESSSGDRGLIYKTFVNIKQSILSTVQCTYFQSFDANVV